VYDPEHFLGKEISRFRTIGNGRLNVGVPRILNENMFQGPSDTEEIIQGRTPHLKQEIVRLTL
jgi:hypothetical protein